MSVASAVPPIRLLAPVLLLALLAALLLAPRGESREAGSSLLLAPSGACAAADDASAPAAAQAKAVTCLVNRARAKEERRRLASRPALQRASAIKGRRVAACGQFSHTPCGAAVTAGLEAAGYRYGAFGENLFVGTWGAVTPRQVVAGWLESRPHRMNILRRQFRHVGAAPTRASGLLGGADAVVWTITFASPR